MHLEVPMAKEQEQHLNGIIEDRVEKGIILTLKG